MNAMTTDTPLVVVDAEGERTTPEPNPLAAVILPIAPGVMTDAMFEELLDEADSRRFYEKESAFGRAEWRARCARKYALQCSPMVEELRKAMLLSDALREQLLVILRRFAPLEAARMIETAGLRVPAQHRDDMSWTGDHFARSHRRCRKALKVIRNFGEDIWETIEHFLPPTSRRTA
jgi:thymidylate synthase ThyX